MAYISKRTGKEVDALLDKVEQNGGGASITIDTELSEISNNAIANSVVTKALAETNKVVHQNTEYITYNNELIQINSEEVEKINYALGEKANDKGYYPQMSVGFADNLTGRNVATPEQFTYRASAGEKSIGDEGARIKRIKGNSVVQDGELISMHTEAIRTVGFNQWDEQWVNGRADIYSYGLRSKNFVKVLPNTDYYLHNGSSIPGTGVVRFYDKNANLSNPTDYNTGYINYKSLGSDRIFTTPSNCAYILFYIPSDTKVTEYNNNVCLNLSHSTYKNGTYSPYRTFTRQLPDLGVMRSAGEAFDEIRFNSEAQKWEKVTRIGDRAYQLGDENNDAVTTDGKAITNYELAEPKIEELDWAADTNLDYAVEDFGTEEAISSVPSAPFSADIIYPFNAVDTIRANARAIEELQAAIAQMSEAMSINHEE